jgi:phage baseplate assembly protein W
MPSLTFTGLQNIQITTNKYTYSDLHLDLTNPISKDLKSDYDETAVRNSIYNLFNTIPGQNLLNPNYGLNLVRYLFEPVNEITGRAIGEDIINGLTLYEPRVIVKNVDIQSNADEQTYYITLSIEIPILNAQVRIPGTLTNTGFTLS